MNARRGTTVFAGIALSLALIATHAAWSQCLGSSRLEFQSNSDPQGLLSFISAAGTTVSYVPGVTFPNEVVVNVMSSDVIDPLSTEIGTPLDTRLDTLSIVVTAKSFTPGLSPPRISGGVADVVRGRAIFNVLTVYEARSATTEPTRLEFSLQLPNGTIMMVSTGNINAVFDSSVPVSVRFANFGQIVRQLQPVAMPLLRTGNSITPLVRIEPLSASGKVLTDSSFRVTSSCTAGNLNPSQWDWGPGQNIDVSLSHENGRLNDVPTCTFNISTPTWSRLLVTGPITLVSIAQRSRFMYFDPVESSIPYENSGGSGALDVPLPPVVIKLYTSSFEFDPSNTGLVITAYSAQGQIKGAEAVVIRGVATFSELRFVDTEVDNAVITFVAGSQGRLPVTGAVLFSGPMKVAGTTVKQSRLDFSPLSKLQANVPLTIRLQGSTFVLPYIVVVVKDSAGQFDSTANNIRLQIAPGSPPVATIPGQDWRLVTRGLAAWSDITLKTNSKLDFRIIVTDDNKAVKVPLQSGPITVQPESYSEPAKALALFAECKDPAPCTFSIRFADTYTTFSSYLYQENQPIFMAVGGRVPTIRVELHDEFGLASYRGALTSSVVPALFVMTGADPRNEELLVRGGSRDQDTGGRTQGIFKNGVYEFSCLEFASAPTGLIRLRFAAYNVSAQGKIVNQLEGMGTLVSGFVTVTSTVVRNFALRFDNANSLITYEGQIMTGAVNIALPPITVQLVDSNNLPDASGDGFVISVSSTSGDIDASGSREIVSNGKAVFSNIKFTAMGNEPRLVFTAFQTNQPVQGKSISTGVFVLAALPIPFFEIAFTKVRSEFADVTYQFQTMTFATLADAQFKVSIFVRDSAHQVHSSSDGNVISIESVSDEAQIENRAGSTIVGLDPLCNCANFTTAITRANDIQYPRGTAIYVRYRVTAGPALLLGKQLVVGPIIIEQELRPSGSTAATTSCEASLITPVILGEFALSPAAFVGARAATKAALATRLGVEPQRVTILDDIKSITRRDFDTGGEWTGTLARIIFSNPFPSSTNLRTSAQLADEFVKLRPQCDKVQLNMRTAYFEEDVKTCDVTAFRASLDAAHVCARSLFVPLCQCYDEGPAAIWGFPCEEEPTAQTMLVEMCSATVDCSEASIQAVCSGLVSALATSLAWLWALLGSTVGLIMIVLVLRKKGVTFGFEKLRLNFYDRLGGGKPNTYEVE